MPDETDESNSFLEEELGTLKSIYINELNVENNELGKPEKISIDLFPATADNVDEQYVRITLIFNLSEEYPENLPEINIRNPRGLSDEMLNRISQDLGTIAEEKKGNSMLYELIEAAKEHLTTENRPSGQCAICLYGFNETDVFTRTECFHYFHSHCLARYSLYVMKCDEDKHSSNEGVSEMPKKELLCPMCRVPLMFRDTEVDYPPPSSAEEDSFAINQELGELQKKMADLYQKQIEKGGIIDIEAEKNKYLLEISHVPTSTNQVEKPNLDSKTGESEPQDDKSCPKSPSKEKPADTAEANAQNNVKPVFKQKFKRPEDRRFDRNNRYDRRYNNYANGNARDYRYYRNDAQDSRPSRKPKKTLESHHKQDSEPFDSGEENTESKSSDKADTETSKHNDEEETSNEAKQFRPRYSKDQRYSTKTRPDFRRKQFPVKDKDLNSESVLDDNQDLESKASVPTDLEATKNSNVEEPSNGVKQFSTRYSKEQRYNTKPRYSDYPRRDNNFRDKYPADNDSYNYNRSSDSQYYNNRPYSQNQRRNYQTNRRSYQQDEERNVGYSQKLFPGKSDGYYSKPRFNSRGNRFNGVRRYGNKESVQVDNLDDTVSSAEASNTINSENSSEVKEPELHIKSNTDLPEDTNVEHSVPNRPRKNMHRPGPKYSNNFEETENHGRREPERYNKREPGHYDRRNDYYDRRDERYDRRDDHYDRRDEHYDRRDEHYDKREPNSLRNKNSHYNSPRRNRRDFHYNSHPRYNQVSQDSEQSPKWADKKNLKSNGNKSSNQEVTQQEKGANSVDQQAQNLQNKTAVNEPCCPKSQEMAIPDNTAISDLHNSNNFPSIPPKTMLPPPPGFADPSKKVIYGLSAANPPPGFHRS